MVQRWSDVVFLHWSVDPASVQRLLPAGVAVDTFAGEAWVGLVPFRMEGLGFPFWSPLPHVGAFPEINVRTYVRVGSQPGVWFFSLDVDRALPVAVARSVYQLPYCLADAHHGWDGEALVTRVGRRWPSAPTARTAVRVRPGAAVDPADPLHAFLTARWGLYSASRRGRLRYAPVDHPVWPLHAAELVALDDTLVEAAGLPRPDGPPHVLWSPGVPVRVGRPARLRSAP